MLRLFTATLYLGCAFGLMLAVAQTPSPASKKTTAKPGSAKSASKSSGAAKRAPAAPSAAPVATEPAVLTVGDTRLSKADFEGIISALPPQIRAQAENQAGRKQLGRQIADILAMANEARKQKFDQEPLTQVQIRFQTDQALATGYLRHLVDNAPSSESALREYFEQHKSEYEQVVARHILIRFQGSRVALKPNQKDLTDEEALAKAQEIKKRLAAGEAFADLAKAESDDVGSAATGGSLGAFGRGQMVKPFEEAAFMLPIGQVSEPVRSPFGYHLIEVQEKKNQSFEDVKPMLEQRRKPDLQRQLAEEMRNKSPAVFDEAYFGK